MANYSINKKGTILNTIALIDGKSYYISQFSDRLEVSQVLDEVGFFRYPLRNNFRIDSQRDDIMLSIPTIDRVAEARKFQSISPARPIICVLNFYQC